MPLPPSLYKRLNSRTRSRINKIRGTKSSSSSLGKFSVDELEELARAYGFEKPQDRIGILGRIGRGLGALSPVSAIVQETEDYREGINKSDFLSAWGTSILRNVSEAFTGKYTRPDSFIGQLQAKSTGREVTKEIPTFSKALENIGVTNKYVKAIGGFAGDVLLDPTTYVTFGMGSLFKPATQVLTRGGRILNLTTKGTKRLAGLADDAEKVIIKRLSKTRADRVATLLEKPEHLRGIALNEAKESLAKIIDEGAEGLIDKGGMKFMGRTIYGTPRLAEMAGNTLTKVAKADNSIGRFTKAVGELFDRDFLLPKEFSVVKQRYYTAIQSSIDETYKTLKPIAQKFSKKEREVVMRAIEKPELLSILPESKRALGEETIKTIRSLTNNMAEQEMKKGVLGSYIDNYIPYIFKNTTKARSLFPDAFINTAGKVNVKNNFAKERLFPSLDSFIEYGERNGLEPVKDFFTVMMLRKQASAKAIASSDLLRTVKNMYAENPTLAKKLTGTASLEDNLVPFSINLAHKGKIASATTKLGAQKEQIGNIAEQIPEVKDAAKGVIESIISDAKYSLKEIQKLQARVSKSAPLLKTRKGIQAFFDDEIRGSEELVSLLNESKGKSLKWYDQTITRLDKQKAVVGERLKKARGKSLFNVTKNSLRTEGLGNTITQLKTLKKQEIDLFKRTLKGVSEDVKNTLIKQGDTLESLATRELSIIRKQLGVTTTEAQRIKSGAKTALAETRTAREELINVVKGKIQSVRKAVKGTRQELSKAIGEKQIFIPDIIARDLETMNRQYISDDALKNVLGAYDKLLNIFKWAWTSPWPGFHIRNAIGNVAQNALDIGLEAFNPVTASKVMAIMAGKEGSITTKLGQKITFTEIRKLANRYGITSGGFFKGELGEKGMFELTNRMYRFGQEVVGSNIENHARLTNFMINLRRGFDPDMAAARTNQFLFDYANGLSDFEKNVMRKVFPFWVFQSKNLRLQLKTMLTQPGKISGELKGLKDIAEFFGDPMTEEDISLLPDWMKRGFGFKKGDQYVTGLGLPVENLSQYFSGKEVLGMVSPLFRVPFEMIYGLSLWKDVKIKDDTSGRFAKDMPLFMKKFLEYREVPKTKKDKSGRTIDKWTEYYVNGERKYILFNTPTSRLVSSMGTFYDKDRSEVLRALHLLTGVREYNIELDKQREIQKRIREDMVQKYLDIRGFGYTFERFVPDEKAIEDEFLDMQSR